ncbi:MAG: hypothetical protein ACD_10C00721G0002 [uncultured bacterium]|nr:MAG: hypothetical protein ACD_10C00721G0002 [uncultured bacterium]
MQFPITVGLRRSRLIDVGLSLLTLLATVVAFGFPQSTTVQLLFCGLIWASAGLIWWQLSSKFVAIRLERGGQVLISHHGGEFLPAEILPGATVHPWLTVVRFKAEDAGTYRLIATVDSLNQQDFCRLRVFLRWQADFSGLNDEV